MMREIVLATRNRDKGRELQELLADEGFLIRTMADFPDAPEVIEDGATCRENAVKKAVSAAHYTGLTAVADDTGLEVVALGGQPGVHAARYAGTKATYEDNCRKLLGELAGVPPDRRQARFITVAAIAFPDGRVHVTEGTLEGRIAESPSGTGGFGYDPVFWVPERGQTLADMPASDKNRISHRARAFQRARELLQQCGPSREDHAGR